MYLNLERDTHCLTAHVVSVPLDRVQPLLKTAKNSLTPSDYEAFLRLKAPSRKETFLMGRVAAKQACLEWWGPHYPVEITKGIFGQPQIKPGGNPPTGISITHKSTLALALAYPLDHPMAIDLETMNPQQLPAIHSQLTQSEHQLCEHSLLGSAAASVVLWTVKEALSKVLGCGLTTPFSVFEINTFEDTSTPIRSTFSSFTQYQCLSWIQDPWVMSIVLPKNTRLLTESTQVKMLFEPPPFPSQ